LIDNELAKYEQVDEMSSWRNELAPVEQLFNKIAILSAMR